METVWLRHNASGERREVEATPEVLGPLMITGWSQCEPPKQEVEVDVEN